jgi:hypothetical protein
MQTHEACSFQQLRAPPSLNSRCFIRVSFKQHLPYHAAPKGNVLILAISASSAHTDPLIVLQCNLDATGCNVLFSCAITDTINPIYLLSGAILAGLNGNIGRCRDVI